MWGEFDPEDTDLISLHLQISNHLAGKTWSRCQIWGKTTSVHEWRVASGPGVAFDVYLGTQEVTLTLVLRDLKWRDPLANALRSEGVSFTELPNKPGRYKLSGYALSSSPPQAAVAGAIAREMADVREKLEHSLRAGQSWADPDSGISVRFAVKPPRKESPEIIFLFSSIRTKQHWLDFGGPGGDALASNRAQVVFLEDTFAKEYTYHLALHGETDILRATRRFVKAHVEKEGYSWGNVTLAGMSKGGTSALAVGAGLPSCNVVALAPQLSLGEYLVSRKDSLLESLSGADGVIGSQIADSALWGALRETNAKQGVRNCLILTSTSDPMCTDRLPTLQNLLGEGCGYMAYVDDSGHCGDHFQTVQFLASPFLSVLSLVGAGVGQQTLRAWS